MFRLLLRYSLVIFSLKRSILDLAFSGNSCSFAVPNSLI